MTNPFKAVIHSAGRSYCRAISKAEYEAQSFRRVNERPIEYRFAFESIRIACPKTVLDVGTGESALPSLMRTCGPIVTAIDNVSDYWPAGMVNRHYHIKDEDATRGISGKFDLITCISVLEHIHAHEAAIASMLRALNPGGHLALTFPYNEQQYIPNAYALPDAGYGKDLPYVAQIYSRRELDRWFGNAGTQIVQQEYWRVFSGPFWTVGETLKPPIQSGKDQLHQLTCLLIRNDRH